jgi:hypothetical protein
MLKEARHADFVHHLSCSVPLHGKGCAQQPAGMHAVHLYTALLCLHRRVVQGLAVFACARPSLATRCIKRETAAMTEHQLHSNSSECLIENIRTVFTHLPKLVSVSECDASCSKAFRYTSAAASNLPSVKRALPSTYKLHINTAAEQL